MGNFIQKKNISEKVCGNLFLAAAFIMLIFFGFRFSVSAKELRTFTSFSKVEVIPENQYEIPKEYHFSAQIQRDAEGNLLTEFVPFGDWDNEEKDTAAISEEAVVTRITGDRKKGKIGAWYYNVGKYQGKTVDLKCTVVDYEKLNTSEDGNGARIGWVALSEERIGLYLRHLKWAELKLEFYDAGTGELLPMKSSAVITDVDAGEGMMVTSEYDSLMVREHCTLQEIVLGENVLFVETEEKEASDEKKDSWAQIQVLFEGAVFQYRMYGNPENELKALDETKTDGTAEKTETESESMLEMNSESLSEDGRIGLEEGKDGEERQEAVNGPTPPEFMFQYQGYSDCRLAPLTVGTGNMTVTDADEEAVTASILNDREETFAYNMTYTVSPEYENWYYDSFTVTSQLTDQLEYISGKVCNDNGENVTSQFYLREEDGLVIFEAKQEKNKSFYGKTYLFTIEVRIKEGADIEPLWNGLFYSLPQKCQVEIQRNAKTDIHKTISASARVDAEYVDGSVLVSLKDALSGAELADGEVVLLEWDEKKNAYLEKADLIYSKEKAGYYLDGLKKNHNNQGKYKVVEKKLPEHYTGFWEMGFRLTKNREAFSFEGVNQPTGETLVRMSSVIIKADQSVSEEIGSQKTPIVLERGDRIQYHIYVERDSALTFKSGELILKNKIPEGAVYEKETLNLIGEILHPVENSTAKIASVRLSKEGELTWKINHLDEGEIAHLLFEVSVPDKSVIFSDYSELTDGEKCIQSNTLEHQLQLPELTVTVQSLPASDVIVHPREEITYEMIAENKGDTTAKNVIVRIVIPDGISYVENSLSCDHPEAQLHLAKETSGESDKYKMVYAILPQMEAGESVHMKVKVHVDRDYTKDTVEVYGEIREVWQSDVDVQQIALEKEGYLKSASLIHKVEKYPDIEAPKEDESDGGREQENADQENVTSGENEDNSDIISPEEVGLGDSDVEGDTSGDGGIGTGESGNRETNTGNGNHSKGNGVEEKDAVNSGNSKQNTSGNAVKTGDSARTGFYLCVGVLALLVVGCSYFKRTR